MSRARDLARLEELSRLMLDHKLSQLRDAAALCDRSRMQIAALDRPAEPVDLPPVAAEQVGVRYQLWADARRGELNLVLARQTAAWVEARRAAQQSFGQAEALRGLAERLRRKL